jgi:two-component system invasion response regulator UvrY
MTGTITVMLVDDHAVVRAGYRMLLGQTPFIEVICEAETGEEACQKFMDHCPQVIVMDLNLPGIGGLAALRRIRARDDKARILMFSIHDEAVYVQRALAAGACGYITKSCAPDTLIAAVISVAKGTPYLEAGLNTGWNEPVAAYPSSQARVAGLSAREFDVFRLLASGYSTRDAADELHLSVKTVANYATSIKEKLKLGTTADMVRLAFELGLIHR